MNHVRIRHFLTGLMATIAVAAIAAVGSSTPSMAQVASAQLRAGHHSLVEDAAYVARRGVFVGRGYRGAHAAHRGYGYRDYGRGAGVGAAVAGALIGGALAAPYYRQPYGYYQQPYGYYRQPYGYDGY